MKEVTTQDRLAILSDSREKAMEEATRKHSSYSYIFSNKVHGENNIREYIFYRD